MVEDTNNNRFIGIERTRIITTMDGVDELWELYKKIYIFILFL